MASRTPFSMSPMNSLGMTPPRVLSANSKPRPRFRGSTARTQCPKISLPPIWRAYFPSPSAAALDRFLVGDLGLAQVGLDAEFPLQPVHQDLEMELAHALDEGLPRHGVLDDLHGGILQLEAAKGVGQLDMRGLGLGLDRCRKDRFREPDGLEDDRGGS